MYAYMTNGTYAFLKKMAERHKEIEFHFMHRENTALAYYEGGKKNIFVSGRGYEILLSIGEIKEKGFVIMNNIPVTDEGRPLFENHFKKQPTKVDAMPGFLAFRLLRPLKGNTYVIFTQWKTEQDYDRWKNSEQFKKAHLGLSPKPPAYFADRPFLTSYHMVEEE